MSALYRGKCVTNMDPIPIPGDRTSGQRAREIKLEVIEEYGGLCDCCGESNLEFLQIDHVDNDGADHRRAIGMSIYKWLHDNGCPKDGFRLLCANCNWSRGQWGYCPHELQSSPFWELDRQGNWRRPPFNSIPRLINSRVWRIANKHMDRTTIPDRCICGCGRMKQFGPFFLPNHEDAARARMTEDQFNQQVLMHELHEYEARQ